MDGKDWLVLGLVAAGGVVAWSVFRTPPASTALPERSGRGRGIVKGKHVKFELENHKIVTLPASYGMIHDPKGIDFPRCHVYFAPFRKTQQAVDLKRDERAYFGSTYEGHVGTIVVPSGLWQPIGNVVQIFYWRPGKHEGSYFHPFKWQKLPQKLVLSRNGSMYRLTLPAGCIVNDRGFVYP